MSRRLDPAALLAWRPGAYARSSGHLFVWLLLRALCQAIMVVVLSRTLGAVGYGRFVAVLAVASFLTPFAGMGLAGVLLRDGARKPERVDAYLRSALKVWLPSAALCIALGIGLAFLLLPAALPWLAVVVLVIGEVMAASLTDLLARSEQARHRVGRYGAITAGLHLLRLLALLAYVALAHPTAGGWMWLYAISSIAYLGILWAWLHPPKAIAGNSDGQVRAREGLPFALGALSVRLQAEYNKPALAHLGFQYAGNFSVAQRFVDLASLPLLALQDALWPKLYADPQMHERMLRTGIMLLGFALAGGAALWVVAEWLPVLLGAEYAGAVRTLQLLALLPALQLVRNLLTVHNIHLHRTGAIGWAYAAGGVFGVIVTAVLVHRYGLHGAVAAIYLVEMLVIAVQLGFSLTRTHRTDS